MFFVLWKFIIKADNLNIIVLIKKGKNKLEDGYRKLKHG